MMPSSQYDWLDRHCIVSIASSVLRELQQRSCNDVLKTVLAPLSNCT
jgi:hypothetical protein